MRSRRRAEVAAAVGTRNHGAMARRATSTRRSARVAAAAAAIAGLLATQPPSVARAQTPMDMTAEPAPSTFDDDATGVLWGVGVLEAALVAGVATAALAQPCGQVGCGVVALGFALAGLAAAIPIGLVAQANDWPADVPLVFHETLWGLAGGWLLAGGALRHAPELALGIAAGIAVAMGTYAFARRDTLLRDPATNGETHYLVWVPPIALLGGLLAVRRPSPLATILLGAAYVVLWGIGVTLVEVAAASSDP